MTDYTVFSSIDCLLARASVLPYLVAWALYQGSLLMTVLNWTGLVVNGCVSFLLPMILVLKSIDQQQQRGSRRREEHGSTGDEETARDDDDTAPVEAAPLAVIEPGESERAAAAAESAGDDAMVMVVEVEEDEGERVYPLPSFVEPYRRAIVVVIIAVFVMIIGLTMVLDALS